MSHRWLRGVDVLGAESPRGGRRGLLVALGALKGIVTLGIIFG